MGIMLIFWQMDSLAMHALPYNYSPNRLGKREWNPILSLLQLIYHATKNIAKTSAN